MSSEYARMALIEAREELAVAKSRINELISLASVSIAADDIRLMEAELAAAKNENELLWKKQARLITAGDKAVSMLVKLNSEIESLEFDLESLEYNEAYALLAAWDECWRKQWLELGYDRLNEACGHWAESSRLDHESSECRFLHELEDDAARFYDAAFV